MTENILYTFTSKALGSDEELTVVGFKGFSGISKPYEYTLTLKSESPDLDMAAMLRSPCTFTINLSGDITPVHGVLSDFWLQRPVGKYFLYRAVLVPRIWQLSLYHTNEVYLGMDITEIIEAVLAEGGLSTLDYEITLLKEYKKWEYRCQFGENHLQFLSRLMEYEGIYYYFAQGEEVEKIIFCDSKQFHAAVIDPDFNYQPASGLDLTSARYSLFSFVCRQKRMPRKVVLKDYDYQHPTLDVTGEAMVDEGGTGEIFIYGENFDTPEEGQLLAQVRSQEIFCAKEEFHGESVVCRLNPGYLFNTDRHFRKEYNRQYLLTSLNQEGVSPSHMTDDANGSENRPAYSNSFTAIPANVQFRPERTSTKPKFYGTINAVVDAEGTGQYAELDDHGRYKIILPFDRVLKNEGKASHWIRMASPYGGSTEGMHFPLRKGTEVLLTFINGDPDQPIIAGAVPNADTPNVVTGKNQSNSMIKTAGGNLIEMEDKEGSNRIKLESPETGVYMHLGAANAPGNGVVTVNKGVKREELGGGLQKTMVSKTKFDSSEYTGTNKVVTGSNHQLFNEQHIYTFAEKTSGLGTTALSQTDEIAGKHLVERRVGDKYTWTDGDEYTYGGGDVFEYGNSYSEAHADIAGATDLAKQATWDGQKWATPTAAQVYGAVGFDPGKNFVEKVWADTITYQCGNNYSWGDTMDYGFGNGWEESIVEPSSDNAINKTWTHENVTANVAGTGSLLKGSYHSSALSIDSDTALVEKTIGDTYSFQKGKNLEIAHGNAVSQAYGDAYEYQQAGTIQSVLRGATGGTSYATVTEDTYANVTATNHGTVTENQHGNVTSTHHSGDVHEYHNSGNIIEHVTAGTIESAEAAGAKSEYSAFGALACGEACGAKIETNAAGALLEAQAAGAYLEASAAGIHVEIDLSLVTIAFQAAILNWEINMGIFLETSIFKFEMNSVGKLENQGIFKLVT